MKLISRYSLGGLGALAVTTGLGLWMTAMIAVDFIPNEKGEELRYDINPVAEDIAPPSDRVKLDPYKKVETPPPPTPIEYRPSGLPTVTPTGIPDNIPPFELPDLYFDTPILTISNTNAVPILRYPPIMPPRADRSGHCKVQFDVSSQGSPFNIVATSCTQSLFERPSIKAVERWKFKPKVENDRTIAMTGVQNQITFHLTDERGQLIPE